MIGHLGSRVSALLDGQLPQAEEERAWEHVHGCHFCRDLVEREGWVKTRLTGLTYDEPGAPARLKGTLLHAGTSLTPGDAYLLMGDRSRARAGLVALGSGAVGAAVLGVLAIGVAPANAPSIDRRGPVTSVVGPSVTPRQAPPAVMPASVLGRRLGH